MRPTWVAPYQPIGPSDEGPFAGTLGRPTTRDVPGIPVADRRCWWRGGQKHCRRLARPASANGYSAGGSDYYEQDARTLPVGSQRWWDIRDREGSTGKP
jgi:hypothetical protein